MSDAVLVGWQRPRLPSLPLLRRPSPATIRLVSRRRRGPDAPGADRTLARLRRVEPVAASPRRLRAERSATAAGMARRAAPDPHLRSRGSCAAWIGADLFGEAPLGRRRSRGRAGLRSTRRRCAGTSASAHPPLDRHSRAAALRGSGAAGGGVRPFHRTRRPRRPPANPLRRPSRSPTSP